MTPLSRLVSTWSSHSTIRYLWPGLFKAQLTPGSAKFHAGNTYGQLIYHKITWNCRLITWNCRLITWTCRLITWNCRLITWNCRLITWNCRLITWNCRLITWTNYYKPNTKNQIQCTNCEQWTDYIKTDYIRLIWVNRLLWTDHIKTDYIRLIRVNRLQWIDYSEPITVNWLH